MSYINDALKKAQHEKDNRYVDFGGILRQASTGPIDGRGRWILISLAVFVVLIAAVAVLILTLPNGSRHALSVTATATKTQERRAVGPGAEALYESALKLQRAGRNADAAALYERALLQEPGHVKALNNLGVILMGQKRRGRAAELFGKAIAMKGDYVDPYYNLACLYAQAGDHAQSLRYLNAALAISREVKQWAAADADLKMLRVLPEYRKMMEEKQ